MADRNSQSEKEPREFALRAMHALAAYKEDCTKPGERMHEQLATRLARVAARNNWE